ncbi:MULTISPECIES: ATP-binding cassette domain-containing protein [Bacillaceae]|uniref:Proline/glycine betaine ABC transporter ATP-binding protein n=1 Tax=Gottfriedia luciferensis TaxID=178774 RepID=A0ABX2ZUC6_9BACI|nr:MULTISPECIES: ATP-binding cassette domain-containing protein [Bacillaceae]ODG93410.1 proline/glycine betaine ABC transporter ATP-binding protein [Gottfriedia luciferensis]PGZ88793.1 proline/glycine betaine ABC transporter ATP-binding protein [Bacillus sp. AFS029533]
MIQFQDISFRFSNGKCAVQDLSFSIETGECFVLIGPSGCGKTTTIKLINRLIKPTDGEIFYNDKNIKEYDEHKLRREFGYVLQQIALFPHLNVEENISIVPELKKWNKAQIKERTHELLELVKLNPLEFSKRSVSELSGGQQQRVGVARALAGDPNLLLMDEPFSALDPITRLQLQKDLKQLKTKINKTILFVTHDLDEAFYLGNRIGIMHDGELVQVGTKDEILNNPVNPFVEQFIDNYRSKVVVKEGI